MNDILVIMMLVKGLLTLALAVYILYREWRDGSRDGRVTGFARGDAADLDLAQDTLVEPD